MDMQDLVTSVLDISKSPFSPQSGYDYIAAYYDKWRWSKFWRINESPIIIQWLNSLPSGFGLDAGSGTGTYIGDAVKSHRCVALDISFQMLKRSMSKIANDFRKVSYLQANLNRLPYKNDIFDWILCSRVLSHIPDITTVLQEFTRVLKPGGECLISDVHPNHPYTQVKIPIKNTKIAIETHKHPVKILRKVIDNIPKLKILSFDEYYFTDLRVKPSRVNFGKLYHHPNPAIFYICKVKKL